MPFFVIVLDVNGEDRDELESSSTPIVALCSMSTSLIDGWAWLPTMPAPSLYVSVVARIVGLA